MTLTSDIYQGLHILVVSDDEARSRALTKALRDLQARMSDGQASLRDPTAPRGVDLILFDERADESRGAQLTDLQRDVRARWAALVRVDLEQLVKSDGSVLMAALTDRVAPLVEADRALTARAREEEAFHTSLAPLGPWRALRALSLSGHTLLVELRGSTLNATVELANELLVSAAATRGEKHWDAWSALVRILGLHDAELAVTRRAFTGVMNIMEPVDQALEVAAQERHCSAAQIALEEASDSGRAKPSHTAHPAASAPPQAIPKPNLGHYAPPRPSRARTETPLAQRTLLGLAPRLPALGAAPAKPLTTPSASEASASAPPDPASNDARSHGVVRPLVSVQRPKATLLGLARDLPNTSSAPAEPQPPQESVAVSQGQAQPEAPEAIPTASGDAADERELPDFDPPTSRLEMPPDLLDDLDNLALAPASLGTPLPPPRSSSSANDNHVPLLEAVPDAPFELDQELLAETSPTPTDMRSHLIARSTDEHAQTARPPAHLAEQPGGDEPTVPEALEAPLDLVPSPAAPSSPPPRKLSVPPPHTLPGQNDALGDETWVVARARKSAHAGRWTAGIVLLIVGVLVARLLWPKPATEPAAALTATQQSAPKPAAETRTGSTPRSAQLAAQPVPSASPPPNTLKPTEPLAAAEPPEAVSSPAAQDEPAQRTPDGQPTTLAEHTEPSSESEAASRAEIAPPKPAPTDLKALLKTAQRLVREHNAREARQLFEQALTLDAANPHVHAGMAEALLDLNEPSAALPEAQAAIRLRPKRARYQVLLGDVWIALGKPEEAKTAFQKALDLDENETSAKQRLEQL